MALKIVGGFMRPRHADKSEFNHWGNQDIRAECEPVKLTQAVSYHPDEQRGVFADCVLLSLVSEGTSVDTWTLLGVKTVEAVAHQHDSTRTETIEELVPGTLQQDACIMKKPDGRRYTLRLVLRRASACDPTFHIETLKQTEKGRCDRVDAWGHGLLWPCFPLAKIDTAGPRGTRFHTVISCRSQAHPDAKSTHVVKGRALVGGAALAIAAPYAVMGVVGWLGFSSGGIVAGSTAAGMMSAEAVASGGTVAAGGLVATLQSVGAAGLGTAGTAGAVSVGGVAGAAIGVAANSWSDSARVGGAGRWTVMTEEWWGKGVATYIFVDERCARDFFDEKWACGRILVNPLGQEVMSGVFVSETNGALRRVRAAWQELCDPSVHAG
eukprot:TRINITY_DN91441_c0_g1_i1.p1 TRINITY_DN91441_c0_g1~~TRINITY_DN91441_c0_g1_i1.p1  ORF type:complete len:381 (-),score=43.45 TRINITY_DN91441_c0_g1_i1:204-1346(-)